MTLRYIEPQVGRTYVRTNARTHHQPSVKHSYRDKLRDEWEVRRCRPEVEGELDERLVTMATGAKAAAAADVAELD
jgi:hypothetical protein